MTDRVFIDTNIFVYAYTSGSDEKHHKANELLRSHVSGKRVFISIQVLNEFYSAMSKYHVGHDRISGLIADICHDAEVKSVSLSTVLLCMELKSKYGYSYWDSLILASAIESGCSLVYSEDMQHMQVIEDILTIMNPLL